MSSRAQKFVDREHMIQSFAEAFRRELKKDIGFDIRARIDREKRPVVRGAMLAAEREVYKEMRVDHGDNPGGPLDLNGVELEDAGKGQKMFKCFEGEKGRE